MTPDSLLPGTVIHDRYELLALVGEGGMAKVYRAVDLSSGQQVALKQLRLESRAAGPALTTLFEREFSVLSQLAHPRIVAAYDYGIGDAGPFYTMELLHGTDMHSMAPLDYRKACALGRDVCSALSLIHSRRLVYRDLSPHNVRCTEDGLAKLIDFGALAEMGPRKELIGTLPCVAPEVVARQALDARTDLYALGATLYYALAHRHAYPARNIEELERLWQQRPPMPSDLVPDIPRALDELISDLLEAEPARRPQSATEVMERLRAIAELELDDSLLVRSAYLFKPSLVGRQQATQTFQDKASRAKQGQGTTLRIVGPSGAGLSRLLETVQLEARLKGWLVLHADASTADTSDHAVATLLGRALLRALPRLAHALAEPHLSVLRSVLPELLQGREAPAVEALEPPETRQRKLLPALRQWFAKVAEYRPLLIAVDDVHRSDAPSASFLALLAREARQHRMLLVITQPDDQPAPAHNQHALATLAQVAPPIALDPLSPELTQSLLGSVFGEVPNLDLVARHTHQITSGKPRDVMALALHFVAEGLVRYEAGSWALPSRLSPTELPSSMADGLRQRLSKLSVHARLIAYAASREPSSNFSRSDVLLLLADATQEERKTALRALADDDILISTGDHYRCVRRCWIAPLAQVLSEAEKRRAHLGLSRVFKLRADDFRHVAWLLRAGEHENGLSAMTEFSLASKATTDKDPAAFNVLLRNLPEDWPDVCQEALSLYEHHQRPPRERFAFLTRLAGFVSRAQQEVDGVRLLGPYLQHLEHATGLDCFDTMPSDLAPASRIPTALGIAKERYLALPEHERVLDPGAAIKELVGVIVSLLGSVATTSDFSALRSLPNLGPILPLAPSIQLVHQLAQGLGYRLGARVEQALSTYEALLERIDQPDRAGLDPAYHYHTKTRVLGGIGTLEAIMGRASCVSRAALIEGAPQYEHVGALILYLYHLWQGQSREARYHRRRFEVLQLEINPPTDLQYVFSELCLYALTQDMTGVRRAAHTLESLAPHNVAARAALHYARGEYHRIRGDMVAALSELEQAISLMLPAEHALWANAAGAHVRVLVELGRHSEACTTGEAYLASAAAAQLGYVQNYVRCPLSRALSKLGEHARAQALAEASVEACTGLGITGVNAELAHEVCVLSASEAGDAASVERHLQYCSAPFRRSLARHAKSTRTESAQDGIPMVWASLDARDEFTTKFSTSLVDCKTPSECAERGLTFVIQHLNLVGGSVYLGTAAGLERVAAIGDVADDDLLKPWAQRYLTREEARQVTSIHTHEIGERPREDPEPNVDGSYDSEFHSYIPVLLAHYDENGFATTGMLALHGSLDASLEEAARLGAALSERLGQLMFDATMSS